MDNKVTKKRINDHMEYDWYKYLIIILASILVCYFCFKQINADKDYETIDFFISAYTSSDNKYNDRVYDGMAKEMDTEKYGERDMIRQINFNVQDPLGKDFGTLYQTQGNISSDILIVSESWIGENGGGAFLEMTPELLSYILPGGVEDTDLQFLEFEHTDKTKTRHGIQVHSAEKEGKGTFARMTGSNGVFEMDYRKVEAYKEREKDEEPPTLNFYLVINRKSVSIGKFNSKAKPTNAHALYCVQKFIEFYRK